VLPLFLPSDSIQIFPPWVSIILFDIYKPKPDSSNPKSNPWRIVQFFRFVEIFEIILGFRTSDLIIKS
jgi:hypothetical protein